MAGAELTTLFNLFPELPEAIQKAVSRAVRKAAFDIQRTAAQLAPVDTGMLKSSIYTVTQNSSNYSKVLERAVKKSTGATILDEVEPPTDSLTAYVAVGADYGMYVEFGTVNGPAQPYLTPAVEIVKPMYVASLRELEKKLPLGGLLGGFGSALSVDTEEGL